MTNTAAYSRDWRKRNPGRHAATNKAYRQRHPERVAAYNKRRKAQNGYAWDKAYREKHRPKLQAKWSKRRAMQRAATIGDLTEIAKIYEAAKWWRQWFDVQVDHIIPLARGGAHEASNLRVIYGYENRRKQATGTYKPRVIFCHA